MTKTCPGCGALAPAEARYCRHCGTALRATTGPAGGETISPLAATRPLDERGIAPGGLNTGTQHVSTTAHAGDAQQTSAQLSGADETDEASDSGEITIPVVRRTQTSAPVADTSPSAPAQVASL